MILLILAYLDSAKIIQALPKRKKDVIIKHMKLIKKHKKKIIIFLIIAVICAHCISCQMRGYYKPEWAKKDISAALSKEHKTKSDYEFLFAQTGLGKSAVDDLISEGKTEEIYEFSKQYFNGCEYEGEFIFFPVVTAEQKKGALTRIAPLRRGDVLVSLSTYALGFRHGHAGMVLNGETGLTLEHMVLGSVSKTGRVYSWRSYPTLAVLRYKDAEIAEKAADYAEEKLLGIDYNPLAGIIKKDKSDENPVSSSQCSHLVWQAYKAVGADIDGNGGRLVLPGDLLSCEDFEIVQIYGLKPPKR